MAIKKFRLVKKQEDETYDTLHLETSADLVLCSDGGDVATKLANTVPVTRTVNGKSLAIDIALTAADVNALGKTETASAATKLATARTIRTNLASTSAVSFDGSANVTPGVTGVLPVANGGTGSSSEKYLKLAGGTVTGAVTFSANPISNAVTSVDGVVIQGNLRLKGSGNYGNTLRLGDGDYVHLSEPTDDCLEIKAKEINFITTNSPGLKNNGAALSGGGGITFISQESLYCTGNKQACTLTINLPTTHKKYLITGQSRKIKNIAFTTFIDTDRVILNSSQCLFTDTFLGRDGNGTADYTTLDMEFTSSNVMEICYYYNDPTASGYSNDTLYVNVYALD